MNVGLVNTNRMKPPIAPIGLEYVGEALNAAGHHIEILDLCWEADYSSAITRFFNDKDFGLVGVTLRNTDDCAFTSRQSFLNEFIEIVDTIRKCTESFIVLGGVGFSVMPEDILKLCKADAGIWGDGEFAFVDLANKIEKKYGWQDLPNLIYYRDGRLYRNAPLFQPLNNLPFMKRNLIDNKRYFSEGGQAGIETKRGCPRHCIYCADPVAKGKIIRIRPPKAVVGEMERLLKQGIDHIHTCDSEFNLPIKHAIWICEEINRRGLGEKLHWYVYCSPIPFKPELAGLMSRAGCAGINFGVDSGDAGMLKSLGRNFTPEDVLRTVSYCKKEGLTVMLDLLIGAPRESKRSIVNTIELMKQAEPDRVGVAVGARVYPGTGLWKHIKEKRIKMGCIGGSDLLDPLFFLEPKVEPFVFELLDDLIGEDKRFFFFDPSRPDRNYNYNANQRLMDAIEKGYRGAYWDILRKYE